MLNNWNTNDNRFNSMTLEDLKSEYDKLQNKYWCKWNYYHNYDYFIF